MELQDQFDVLQELINQANTIKRCMTRGDTRNAINKISKMQVYLMQHQTKVHDTIVKESVEQGHCPECGFQLINFSERDTGYSYHKCCACGWKDA